MLFQLVGTGKTDEEAFISHFMRMSYLAIPSIVTPKRLLLALWSCSVFYGITRQIIYKEMRENCCKKVLLIRAEFITAQHG